MKLTAKQEKFAAEVASGKTQADAYRAAYNAEKMSSQRVAEAASRLAADSKVSARIAQLKAPALRKMQREVDTSLMGLTRMLQEAYEVGDATGKASAMVSAVMGIAELHGLKVQRTESKRVGEFSTAEEIQERLNNLEKAKQIRAGRSLKVVNGGKQ